MQVIQVSPVDKKKQKVFLENEVVFALYNSEIRRYHLEEGAELSERDYEEIVKVLTNRARERSFYLLKDSDRTEYQIRKKLKEGFYPPFVIDTVIEQLTGYHYLDDRRYTERYVEQMKERLNRREMTQKLMQRGIRSDLIREIFEETEPGEEEALAGLIRRRLTGKDASDPAVREKTYAFLYRKGYSLSAIREVYSQIAEETGSDDYDDLFT